ncbi:hypothetical protein Taro_040996 [Colocasia esculenta]|uniref:Uncharacterized protein n=1 Tax=Colocasia esculenta TaxID=4460 RepID=A0A843WS33_COLES|nr:hypothetical protein [Colocasia esculenta]
MCNVMFMMMMGTSRQFATGSYEEGDKGMCRTRQGGQNRQRDNDGALVAFGTRRVAVEEKGKKNGLVWAISCSPATKNSSTRPQQDVNSSPRVIMTFKRKSRSRMGMRPSDERSNYESSYSSLL